MYQDHQQPITSFNSLISTINVDKQVRRWFINLLLKEKVCTQVSSKQGMKSSYQFFKMLNLVVLVIDICILLAIVSKNALQIFALMSNHYCQQAIEVILSSQHHWQLTRRPR